MKRGTIGRGWRPLMGVVAVGALALGVSALAAPRTTDDAVRGTNKGKTEVTRLVTGDPAQINAVVAGLPPSAILAVNPVLPPTGGDCTKSDADGNPNVICATGSNAGGPCTGAAACPPSPAYPAGTTISGNVLSTESSEGFRAWFEVQLSNWDPNGNGDPPLKVYQVKIDCTGYMGDRKCVGGTRNHLACGDGLLCPGGMCALGTCSLGGTPCASDANCPPPELCVATPKGGPLANPIIPCTLSDAGDVMCQQAFGQNWSKCEQQDQVGPTCKAGFLDKGGSKHNAPTDVTKNWCTGGCEAGDVATALGCNYNFFAVHSRALGRVDAHIVYYGGTLVLDIPGKDPGPPAKGRYCVELNHDETFLADTSPDPIPIATLEENGFCVEIVQGSCCHHLGTAEAGCIDDTLRNECEIPSNAPFYWAPSDRCDNPPGSEGCKQCLIVGRNTDPLCDDGDACTEDDCTPIFTCVHDFFIAGFNPDKPVPGEGLCCNPLTGALTEKYDGDVCTRDYCSLADNRGSAVHNVATALGDPCSDGNPCTTPDTCDGVHTEADGGCVGADVNAVECDSAADCPDDPQGTPYPCVDGYCFCTLTPKATFVLNTPALKTCIGGFTPGAPCAKDADCTGGGVCDLFADGANCFDSGDNGEKITAVVHIGAAGGRITGGQFLMTYDPSCLDLNPASVVGMNMYTTTAWKSINEAAGTIFIAVSVDYFGPYGGPIPVLEAPLGNVDMISMSFKKIGECNECELCFASVNPQNSYLVDNEGQRVDIEPQCKSLQAKGDLVLDVPANIETNADCDGPTAVETWDPPTATFSCPNGADLICRGAHESGMPMNDWAMGGGVFPQGASSFCCYAWALDDCDQHVGCPPTSSAHDCGQQLGKPEGCWTVQVNDETSLDIDVQLGPPIMHDDPNGELTRCIKFCLFADSISDPDCFSDDVTFGGIYNFIGKSRGKVKVPGTSQWGCITAQDQLHTLRSCYIFGAGDCMDGQLRAQFSGDPAFGGNGNWLIGGNLDGWKKLDDGGVITNPNGASLDVIDILDFGTFVSQFGVTYADNDTPCGTEGPNADINGDGDVTMADYGFVIANFMVSAKDCCGGPQAASLPAPLAEVSVDQLRQIGMGELVVADLNGDGLVNAEDMDAFMEGVRPTKTDDRKGGKGLRSGR